MASRSSIDSDGARHGVEAVVDKDAATALLARKLGADLLLLLTDVPAVEIGWGTADARPIGQIAARELQALNFAPGSMAPKVAAACVLRERDGRPGRDRRTRRRRGARGRDRPGRR